MKTYSKETNCCSVEICETCANKIGLETLIMKNWVELACQADEANCFLCGAELSTTEWTIEGVPDQRVSSALSSQPLTRLTFDGVAEELQSRFPESFVYVGDNHISLHAEEGRRVDDSGADMNPRLLYIEAKPRCVV